MFSLKSVVLPTILCVIVGFAISYGRLDRISLNSLDIGGETETQSCQQSVVTCKLWLPDPKVDLEWIRSQDFWYLPLWDADNAHKFLPRWGIQSNFNSEQLSRNLCPYFSSLRDENDTGFFVLDGTFLPKKIFFNPYRPGVFEIIIDDRQVGTAYLSLTDNKSFAISNAEFINGERHVFVMSRTPTLPQEVIPMIQDQLVELGFEGVRFINMNYENCPLPPERG